MSSDSISVEAATRKRYAEAAATVQPELCCASGGYDSRYLEAIPKSVLDVDYGCGDPSKWLGPGETVLDLGSGSGKICFIAAQIVGVEGRVIGVDFNPPMLELARNATADFVRRIGYDNVEFRNGRIQDLALDLDALGAWLGQHPVTTPEDYLEMDEQADRLRRTQPLIADDAVDVVISNCVLNLVQADQKERLFSEIFRVLRRGGRCVVSDIVSDEPVPAAMQADSELWSGCISGALTEADFIRAFERAGFYGIELVERSREPWQVVQGIEFRSVTVRAFKGKEGPCLERNQAVIYRGPFSRVTDDDGHTLHRGERMAVCDKTFGILTSPPYAESFHAVPPRMEVPQDRAQPFECSEGALRAPAQTKGRDDRETTEPGESCSDGSCC